MALVELGYLNVADGRPHSTSDRDIAVGGFTGCYEGGDTTPPTLEGSLEYFDNGDGAYSVYWGKCWADDDVGVEGYNLYISGDLAGVYAADSSASDPFFLKDSCEVSVTAFDAAGNESAPLSVTIENAGGKDEIAPTMTGVLGYDDLGGGYYSVSWSAASDDVGVEGYYLYINGVYSEYYDAATLSSGSFWLPEPASYVISVTAFDMAGNESDPLSVTIDSVGGGSGNNSFETAAYLGTDQSVTGVTGAAIAYLGEKDYYSFTLTRTSDVTLTTSGEFGGDTVLYLYDGDRSEVSKNDDYASEHNYSQLSARLSAGTYYVKVEAHPNVGTIGNYSLSVDVGPGMGSGNNSFDTAIYLGSDQSIDDATGASIAYVGEEDYYSFSLTATSHVTIATDGNPNADTRLFLYSSDKNEIAFDDDSGEYNLSVIDETLVAGTYYVKVEAHPNVGTISDYSLSIAAVAGGVVPGAAFTADDLNGDGRADVVMTISQDGLPSTGSTGAWLIQSDQTAAWGDLSQCNAGWSIFGTGATSAGKTNCDVYVKSADNVVGAWVTDPTGKVAGWETVGSFDADTQVLGLGDFNGDGQTDLLLRNTNGAVGCYFTSGDVTGWNYFQSLGDEWTVSAIGDLNGDGRDDVVLKHDNGFAGSWLTQSDYTMSWADLDTLPAGFEIVGCGDFDGDGVDDVLLRNMNYYGAWIVEDGSVSSWMGLGDLGSIAVEQIADFDADGIDDLRIRTTSGDLGTQLVKGADTLEWKYYGSVGPEWSTSLAAI